LLLLAAYYVTLPIVPGILMGMQLGYVPDCFVPSALPFLLWQGGREQTRKIGLSMFADRDKYKTITLSEEQKRMYFEDGTLMLRNVFPPDLLVQLRKHLYDDVGGLQIWPWSINGYLDIDELLDFYLFSNLGDIASQLAGEEVTLWSDFRYFRAPGQRITGDHYDGGECEGEAGMLPPSHMNTSRVRFWITLDDHVPGPSMLQTSTLRKYMTDEQRSEFESGHGGVKLFLDLLEKHGETMKEEPFAPQDIRLGDVVLHSPCLWHRSPLTNGTRVVGFLAPTYQPESSRFYVAPFASPEKARRNCAAGLQPGDSMAGNNCFMPAGMASEGMRGTSRTIRFGSQEKPGSRFYWFMGHNQRTMSTVSNWDDKAPWPIVSLLAYMWTVGIYMTAPDYF